MMNDRNHDLPPGLEEQWREWATTEPEFDESQLKRNLLEIIPDRTSRPRARFLLAAVAASFLAVLIGVEITRQPVVPGVAEELAVVHEAGANVILVLREGNEPIYIATESSNNRVEE